MEMDDWKTSNNCFDAASTAGAMNVSFRACFFFATTSHLKGVVHHPIEKKHVHPGNLT